MGSAVAKGCRKIKAELREMAAEVFSLLEEAVTIEGGFVRSADRELSYAELIRAYFGPVRGEVIGIGSARGRYIPDHPRESGLWEVIAFQEVMRRLMYQLPNGYGHRHRQGTNPQQVEAQTRSGGDGPGSHHDGAPDPDDYGRIVNLGVLVIASPPSRTPRRKCMLLVENGDGPGPTDPAAPQKRYPGGCPAVGAAVQEAIGVLIHDLP
jgi:hypothetical protein